MSFQLVESQVLGPDATPADSPSPHGSAKALPPSRASGAEVPGAGRTNTSKSSGFGAPDAAATAALKPKNICGKNATLNQERSLIERNIEKHYEAVFFQDTEVSFPRCSSTSPVTTL